MVIVLGLGAEGGATYVAESATALPPPDCAVNTVSEPHADPLHPPPDNDHASTSLGFEPGTGVSLAMIPAEVPTGTIAGAESDSVKLLVMVSAAEARFEGSAMLCAVSVSAAVAGSTCGAVKLPLASTVPHPAGHAAPERIQVTPPFGFPLLVIRARKACFAPSSTRAAVALSAICKSLAIATCDVPDFVASAALVAAICTAGDAGNSAGAV